jgi:hypothetical protein
MELTLLRENEPFGVFVGRRHECGVGAGVHCSQGVQRSGGSTGPGTGSGC